MKTADSFPRLDATARLHHKIAVWSGQGFILGMIIGWGLIAGFLLPPPSASLEATEVAKFLADGGITLRIGLCVALVGVGGLIPLSAVLGDQLRKMEGGRPIWANAQLVCAGLSFWLLSQSIIFFAVAAFRPERDPALIQLIFDAAWLTLVVPVAMIVLWQAAVGAVILSDRNPTPVMPRWLGYLSIWVALLSAPGFLGILFTEGPFAWSGIFVFWVPFAVFVTWWTALTVQLLKNINAEAVAE